MLIHPCSDRDSRPIETLYVLLASAEAGFFSGDIFRSAGGKPAGVEPCAMDQRSYSR
ncbi:MAG: hypothetical protein M3Z11_11305 [Candidatus Dormibacteraeota bacterium]|nr:hypothetical protein [Candidatus Dormibacteraeota bacterium]